MHDRAMQALHALALMPVAETLADSNSYGFREGRSCADALEHVHTMLSRKHSAPWVLEGDIRACFDEISHQWLLQHVPMDKQILRKWLKAGYWEKGQLYPTSKGTPQGGIISPLLANLALDGMQQALREAVSKRGDKVNFVRYADDFIGTGATQELLEQKAKPALTVFLQQRGLQLSEQKTLITHTQHGFNFLGHTVRKFKDKLLTTPAKSSVAAVRDKIRLCIKSARAIPQETLLAQLNPIIRGWAYYYRHASAKRTFSKLDFFVYRQLRGWLKRRHPGKSVKWKLRKYFSALPGVFSVKLTKDKGKPTLLTLYRATSTPIQRHIKIRGAANPYDTDYSGYFELRRRRRRREGGATGRTVTSQRQNPARTVTHWLQFAAATPNPGVAVGEA